MPLTLPQPEAPDAVMQLYLLGQVTLEDSLALQERLVYEATGRLDNRIDVLLCEHPRTITIGRSGSRGHIRLSDEELRRRQLQVHWVSRGGGCVLHAPQQLAIYPIVPLKQFGWTVGHFMRQFQSSIVAALEDLAFQARVHPTESGRFGIWGRSGMLAAVGVTVRQWVTMHGAFINVAPDMTDFELVDAMAPATCPPGERPTMGCLLAERRQAVRMSAVRAALIEHLAAAMHCPRYHVHAGHPLLRINHRTNGSRAAAVASAPRGL